MKNREVEEKIRTAFHHAVPDVLESVLSDCREQKGTVIALTENKRKSWIKAAAGIAAALVLTVGGILGYAGYRGQNAVASTISLDVNPSIEIRVNKYEKVLETIALNDDAKVVLGDMDFKGSSLDVTMNALIGSMLRNGYLDELANSILISVDNKDPDLGAALQQKLTQEVNALLETNSFTGSVLSQTVSDDDELKTLAETYGITPGKAQLVQQLIQQNTLYSFEELSQLSVNELNLLIAANNTPLENTEVVGSASDKSYIGAEKAKEIAFAHAGVAASDVGFSKAELDFDDGRIVYEVDFSSGTVEYEYEVDALSGAVLKNEQDQEGGWNATSVPTGQADISTDQAKSIALSHAGIDGANAVFYKTELDQDDGMLVYELVFSVDGLEYEYDINASTGDVIKYEWEQSGQSGSAASTGQLIGKEEAKQIALSRAGVAEGDISRYESELDTDDGKTKYEISFHAGRVEYDIEINAVTGAVEKFEMDND